MRSASLGRILLLAGWGAGLAVPSQATVLPGQNLTVEITIVDECVLTAPTTLNFGAAVGVLDAPVTGTTSITVQCTNTTPFSIALSAGAGSGATTAVRKMTGLTVTSATINYSLYQDVDHLILWGTGTDDFDETGTGAAVAYDVFGLVPAQSTPQPQTYRDTVVVTVSY